MANKSLLKKIFEVQKMCTFFKKGEKGSTGSHDYMYVKGSDILTKIRAKMDELGLMLETHITGETTIIDKKISVPVTMVWLDVDTGEERKIPWLYCGTDTDISKAFGKGATYCERYFQLKYFNIPTDEDDPDNPKNNTDKSTVSKKETSEVIIKSGKYQGKKFSEITDTSWLGWVKDNSKSKEYVDLATKRIDALNARFQPVQPPEGMPEETELSIDQEMEEHFREYQDKVNAD